MENFFIYLIKSAGLIVLFWLCFRLFLKRETFFEQHRIFLISGILISILLPLWTLKKIIFVESQPYQVSNIQFPITSEIIEINPISWAKILLIIYVIGVIALTLRFIIQLLSLNGQLKKCTIKKDGNYKIAITNASISPFSFFNTIVYNPTMYNENAIKAIIIHEKIHSDQKHSIDMLIAHLLTIFQWFNPIVWWYKKEIGQNLEYIADKNSTEILEDKKAYQYLLLHQSGQLVPKTTIINPFFNSLIKKRIVMLNQQKSKKINLVKFSLILPLLVVFIFLFNIKTIAQVKETTTQKSQWSVGYGVATNATEIVIDKKTTDEELDKKSVNLKEDHNVDLKFSKIKRNKKGEITALKSTYKTNDGKSGNYVISKDEAIDPILFSIAKNEEGDITSIGYGQPSIANYIIPSTSINTQYNSTNKISSTEVKKIKFKKSESEENDIDEIEIIIAPENDSIMVDEIEIPNQTIQIRGVGASQNMAPLYVVNGIVQEKEFNQNSIDTKNISAINVIRSEDATKKYGEKAAYGVIEITGENMKSTTAPLYIVNGKVKNTISNIDNDKIISTNVLTGKNAIEKYGEKGKNGVIEITKQE
tara:strand:- start:3214 stop:4986 length:1773 start_codon:yes stop_codon:yes gene_type:complete